VRLFVAADLPPAARTTCARWRDEVVRSQPALRPVADAALHVTLSFLGSRSEEEAARLAAVLEACVAPARGLTFDGPRWLPPRRPNVLVLALEDPRGELASLRAAVAAAVDDPEARPFLPHVTVARVRRRQTVRPEALVAPRPGVFAADALTLYSSRTAPEGARYEPLWRQNLQT
jgi:RNA 2',3'-cyclic 3'-phosphodiesterase